MRERIFIYLRNENEVKDFIAHGLLRIVLYEDLYFGIFFELDQIFFEEFLRFSFHQDIQNIALYFFERHERAWNDFIQLQDVITELALNDIARCPII